MDCTTEVETYLKPEPTPLDSGFRMDGYWVWCGSVLEDPKGGYHMYAARWPRTHPMFAGYIYMSEIVRAWSPTMCGPYEYQETVLPSGDPSQWHGRMAHNPTVHKYGDKYLLYFIASTYDHDVPPAEKLEENRDKQDAIYGRIRIGLAIADSPAGPWKALDAPILDTRKGKWDEKVVTNPAPCILPDGRIFLYYRSNTPEGLRIGLAVADKPEGPYVRIQDDPVISSSNIEDPFVWHDGEMFHMFVKDFTAKLCGEINAGAHFISDDGIDWKQGEPKKGYSRKVKMENGEIQELGALERPQLLFDKNGKPACLFAASGDGPGSFHKAENTWNIAIPLKTE